MRTIESPEAKVSLPIASELVARLAAAKVRYGVYKNTRLATAGLAGKGDLDLLVAVGDAAAFRSVVLGLGGVRGVPSPLYDNAVPNREDWFVPDAGGRYLHLDTSFGLRIGRKFHKRYAALQFEDVAAWQPSGTSDPVVPLVTPHEEARIAILRSVFRLPLGPGRAWVPLDSDCARLLEQAFAPGQERASFDYRLDASVVPCTVCRQGKGFAVEARAISQLRKALRAKANAGWLAAPSDFIVNHGRHLAYFLARQWTGSSPGRTVAKRRLEPKGVIVALIGPDGVGKSTQTKRATETFRRSFRCTSVYLGSNDGDWMRFRAALRERFKNGKSGDGTIKPPEYSRKRKEKGRLHVLGSAAWRLIIAVQRYLALRKAMRLAAGGAIVITDRWPQALRYGYLDGPSVPPPANRPVASLLWRIEHRIYQAMAKYHATLTIHLDCDFATSYARKPGDIAEDDFERRIELMEEMRRLDPAVAVVDARKSMDAVTTDLIALVWLALLREASGGAAPASAAALLPGSAASDEPSAPVGRVQA